MNPAGNRNSERVSLLGPKSDLKGDFITGEELVILGAVTGHRVEAPAITVGPGACVTADLHASTVRIEGVVVGDIHADVAVIVQSSARLRGTIHCPSITILEGAVINGGANVDVGRAGTVRETGAGSARSRCPPRLMLSRRRKTDSPAKLTQPAAIPMAAKPATALCSLADCTTLDTAGTLIVNGTVTAPITHDHDVTVGPSGHVTGKIRARAIVVEGEVNGDLHAGDFIRVTATGRVYGDLHAVRISAQTGAQLRGRIVMRQRPDQTQRLDDSSVERLLTQL